MAREYFLAYHSYLETLTELSDAECGRLFRAVLEYSATKKTPDLRGNERFLFATLKVQIDRDSQKYEEKCAANKENVLKRWQNADSKPNDTNEYDRKHSYTKNTKEKDKTKEKENTKTNIKESIANAIPKKKFGEFQNVFLTDGDFEKLKTKFGADCERYIERLSNYIESSGKKYKSHYATILNWAEKDNQNNIGGQNFGNNQRNNDTFKPIRKCVNEYPE